MNGFLPPMFDACRLDRRHTVDIIATAALFTDGDCHCPVQFNNPSLLCTMYQDKEGQTPVTAAGQSVGRIMGQRYSAARGAELCGNGDFSAGASGWTVPGTWTIGGGVASHAGATSSLTRSIVLGPGKTYEVIYTISGWTAGTCTQRFTGGTTSSGIARGANGTFTQLLDANTSNNVLSFLASAGAAFTIDNISVKEVLGWHPMTATAANKPVLTQDARGYWYLDFDSVNDTLATSDPGIQIIVPTYLAAMFERTIDGNTNPFYGPFSGAAGVTFASAGGTLQMIGRVKDATLGTTDANGVVGRSAIGIPLAHDILLAAGANDYTGGTNDTISAVNTWGGGSVGAALVSLQIRGVNSGNKFTAGIFGTGYAPTDEKRRAIRRTLARLRGYDI